MSAKKHKGGYNFGVKLNRRLSDKKSVSECNEILIKRFVKKFKRSGILKELRNKREPITRGQKERQKRWVGKKRQRKRS